jgi:phosphoglucomutase/phosphomannomutase
LPVTGFEDLLREDSWLGPVKGETDRLSRNVLSFRLKAPGQANSAEARITLRPSGTEPKAKAYIEVASAPCPPKLPPAEWLSQCRRVETLGKQLAAEFIQQSADRVGRKLT